MMSVRTVLACFLAAFFFAASAEPANAWLGRAVLRGVAKSATRGVRARSASSLLRRDLARDAASPVRRLAEPRTVFRYTSRAQARHELRTVIAPGRHMTSRAQPGRPLGARTAKKRYGLPAKPEVRETVKLPPGQPIRLNRALGGEAGRGELTSPAPVPRAAIRKVVPTR
jgi:hypothetical protein